MYDYTADYMEQIQALLVRNGYGIKPTRVLDKATIDAIRDFQVDRPWLEVTGVPGRLTLEALEGIPLDQKLDIYPELSVDGYWGTKTTGMLQGVLGAVMGDNDTIVSQPVSNRAILKGCTTGWEFVDDDDARGSYVIGMMQDRLGVFDDGILGPKTIRALGEWYGIAGVEEIDAPSTVVKAMQRALRKGEF